MKYFLADGDIEESTDPVVEPREKVMKSAPNRFTPSRFKVSPRGVMVAVVSAAFSNPALCNTGRVDFAIGGVTVTGADGRGRPLVRGAEVKTGDKIVSSADGRAQIRFSDGAYVSLQPNSEFDIKEYRFSGKADGKESALFGLFKGAMRTVTGLVGGVNRNRYQISTPTATIGIRGTGGLIAIGGDGSTLVTGTNGIWTLTNQGGTLDIPAGTAGFAGANVNVPPQPSTDGPVVPPPQSGPKEPPTIVQGDVVNFQGNPLSLFPPLKSGPGYEFAGVATTPVPGGTGGSSLLRNGYGGSAVFDSSGALTSFTTGTTTYSLAGTQADFGTLDGVIAWGRWTGQVNVTALGTTNPVPLSSNDGLHYVIGMPTPAASMPSNVTFTYNMIGGSSPTFSNTAAGVGPGMLNSAVLIGNFTSNTVNVNLSATAGGTTYTGLTPAMAIGGATFSTITGTATSSGGTFPCSAGCGLSVNGFFSGAGATHAGIVYQISNITTGGNLNGTAAFKR